MKEIPTQYKHPRFPEWKIMRGSILTVHIMDARNLQGAASYKGPNCCV